MIGFVLLCKSHHSFQLEEIPQTFAVEAELQAEMRAHHIAYAKHVDSGDGFKEDQWG